MSKSYWRSAKLKNFGIAALVLAALIGAPLVAVGLSSDLLYGFPPALLFFALGMPLAFLVLMLFKVSIQQGHDRAYEVDTEDKLQRQAVPKRLKSFPVRGDEIPDAHWPKDQRPKDQRPQMSGEGDSTQ